MFAMTHPDRWFSQLALSDILTALILTGLIAAFIIIAVLAPDTSSVKPNNASGQLYQLTPIPPGAK
jgi:hypothetical protein